MWCHQRWIDHVASSEFLIFEAVLTTYLTSEQQRIFVLIHEGDECGLSALDSTASCFMVDHCMYVLSITKFSMVKTRPSVFQIQSFWRSLLVCKETAVTAKSVFCTIFQ